MKTYTRERVHGIVETVAGNAVDRMKAIRQVVEQKQYAKIDGCMCDLFTASIVVQVHDALNDKNKAKFAACKWPIMANIALKLTNRK